MSCVCGFDHRNQAFNSHILTYRSFNTYKLKDSMNTNQIVIFTLNATRRLRETFITHWNIGRFHLHLTPSTTTINYHNYHSLSAQLPTIQSQPFATQAQFQSLGVLVNPQT